MQVVTNEKNVLQMSQKSDNRAKRSTMETFHHEYNERKIITKGKPPIDPWDFQIAFQVKAQ